MFSKTKVRSWSRGLLLVAMAACLCSLATVHAQSGNPTVGKQRILISAPSGKAELAGLMSFDWSKPQPDAKRAILIFHGKGRDVEGYYQTALKAAAIAGNASGNTVFIAPQFLTNEDECADCKSGKLLHWRGTAWESGTPALGPAHISTFEIIDFLLAHLADRSLFPNLESIILAGHSGGAQLTQRYAVVGKQLAALRQSGIRLRFVIANPSSYLYFSNDRPSSSAGCPAFSHWKYGPIDPPAYVGGISAAAWRQLEADYARRDVIYLLGTADNDPHQEDLDVSCAGEAQGPFRLARGQAYFKYLHDRNHAEWNQHLRYVPGVAHTARGMFTSMCGVNGLFDTGSCQDQ
jgi:pimeloyl-ACP methyl ester carboxylesterase